MLKRLKLIFASLMNRKQLLFEDDREVATAFKQYVENVEGALEVLRTTIPDRIWQAQVQPTLENPVHPYESRADDLRRHIKDLMYQGHLLPGLRGDVLGLLEAYDRIPNSAEKVYNYFFLYPTVIPPPLHFEFQELLEVNLDTAKHLNFTVGLLFNNLRQAASESHAIDLLESQADKLERNLITHIYSLDIKLSQKLLLKEVVKCICGLSDASENTADRIKVIAIKHSVF